MRLVWLFGALTLAVLLAVWTTQAPPPRPADAPATAFSAARAMVDVERIARAPHPVGSPEHARVRAYLTERLTHLGLEASEQAGPLSPASVKRLARAGGDPAAAGNKAINLIGVLPGKDGSQPAVMLMAHYDTVVGSPGAADDSAGVAAILEAVRAIRARGPAERDLVVLLTDAEELGLDGARIFFGGHPWRDRIGAVVNLEARGGGGRAAMFETGREAGPTVQLFRQAAARADGGTTATSLAAFMYERMPNGTDFTVPKDRGIGGLNLAFIGRPDQYHSAEATPANLDRGAVQHLGAQALEAADALLRAPSLPARGENLVYSDVFGRWLIVHAQGAGWVLLALAAALGGFAAWRARRRAGLTAGQVGLGLLDGLWFLTGGVILLQAARLLAGPMSSRVASPDVYYTLLRRLPWMEAGAVLVIVALALVVLTGARRARPRLTGGAFAVLTAAVLLVGGFSPVLLALGVVAVGLSLWPGRAERTAWGGWLGLIALVFVVGCALQAAAPEAALLFVWPALLATTAAALAASLDPTLTRPIGLAPAAVATVLGGAWLLGIGHVVFLGVGMDMPGALALIALLVVLFARPLAPDATARRLVLFAAAACLIAGVGLNLSAHMLAPAPAVAAALP
ncbi:M20/M25/M40 family metallo-hydrolase [Brevundimonas naejangsanensis]|uniref:M20/M25/M40 family metallo-hydrolase n=1 Tax=Brevundimonas naejangsanensis TaxID=588932 RepID=A0A494REJ0_9CAUL|nr:M20/M25/M40 family metallo-hydrolase [Brevundimonas naejangsanensis]AYG94768.1 M20/M25/M40 family metallo-hydrolase [Brevundimonas naejangsanensis]